MSVSMSERSSISRQRVLRARLRHTQRGTAIIEVLAIVAVVLTLGGFALFTLGTASETQAQREAACIESLACGPGNGRAATLPNDLLGASGADPDIGRGADGRFGDGRTGIEGAARDLIDQQRGRIEDGLPWTMLGKIDRGEIVPNPDSRLGAYAATGGYPPGTVGHAVHNAIGTIYVALGNLGEENIGRVFNSPEARALYNDPVDSPSGRQMAEIEVRYWENVKKEDPHSAGGNLGSAFPAGARDFLQRNIFGSTPPPPPK
jgi:hypothetical protein